MTLLPHKIFTSSYNINPDTEVLYSKRKSKTVSLRSAAMSCIGALSIAVASWTAASAQEDRIWESLGPSPSTSGQVTGITDREVVGAIHSVAPHPSNPDILYIGSVAGGVWMTSDATAARPSWTDLSDDLPARSIGAVAFDANDATNQTLVLGFGRYSNFAGRGGAQLGVWRTTDGGTNWTEIDGPANTSLDGRNIDAVTARGAVIMAATDNGLWRSADTGGNWNRLSGDGVSGLPLGRVYDLEADGSTANQFYVANRSGVYQSTDGGATWTSVSDATVTGALGGAANIQLAIGPAGEVFVGIVQGGQLASLFRSADGSTGWTALDIPQYPSGGGGATAGIHPGGQGGVNFSIAAEPSDGNVVYVGGDRQGAPVNPPGTWPNANGAIGWTANIWRVDASLATGAQANPITDSGTAGGSGPHADSRDMAFDANGDLIESNDGGVYRQSSPSDATGDWASLNGNLTVTEIHNTAWDGVSHIGVLGAQDNGNMTQSEFAGNRWQNLTGADGGDVAIDDTGSAVQSERYISTQRLGGFTRFTYDQNNVQTANTRPILAEPACPTGTGPAPGGGSCTTLVGLGNAAFTVPYAVNTVNSLRFVIGDNNGIFESQDQGQNVVQVPNSAGGNAPGINAGGSVDPIAAGANGNADALYVGAGDDVWVRTAGGVGGALTRRDPSATRTNQIVDVVIDPNDDQTAYAIDSGGAVFTTADAGVNWTNITGDLATETSSALRALAYSISNIDGAVIVGTDNGVFIARGDGSTVNDGGGSPVFFTDWEPLGVGLPPVPVYDLEYDATDEILLAGTLGSGAWAINMEERDPIDVALVMDKSGSMGDDACSGCEAKMLVLQDAAEIFIQTWQTLSDADDRIAAVFFDSGVEAFTASGGSELPTLTTNGDNVIDYIRSKTDGGATAMGGGTQRAIGILTDDTRPRSIILFTDGMQNRDPMINEQGGVYEISDTGRDPSGVSPTTPPTQLNTALDIAVNTIGVGVTDGVNETLTEISSGADGLHKRTNNADADLRRFFIEQLVDALRDASPQLVDYRYPRTNGSGRDTEDFRINVGAKKVVFVVSWDRRDATSASVRIFQDGVDVTGSAEETRADNFYRVISFDTSSSAPLSSDGTWRVEINASGNMDYEVAALADDGLLNYDFEARPGLMRPTDATTLGAEVFLNGLPYGDDVAVRAVIDKPQESLATILATTPTPPEVSSMARHPGETLEEAKYRYLWLNDADFRSRLQPSRETVALDRTGAGRFSKSFDSTSVAGAYKLSFLLDGDGPQTGVFERREQRFIIVVPGPFSEGGSTIETEQTPIGGGRTKTTVRIRPVDVHGNYLGGDRADEVSGTVVGTGDDGDVSDIGDGWYVIEFDTVDPDPDVTIGVGGDTVATGGAGDIDVVGPGGGSRPGGGSTGARDDFYVALLAGVGGYRSDTANIPTFVGAPGNQANFESDLGFVFGGAVGRYLGTSGSIDWRVEGELVRRKSDTKAVAGLYDVGLRRSWTLMANAAAEFDTPSGLRPYVGAGIGVAFNKVRQPLTNNSVVPAVGVVFEDSSADFAWQAFGGASFPISSRVDIFVQGRYLDAGGGAVGAITDVDLTTLSGEAGLRIRF